MSVNELVYQPTAVIYSWVTRYSTSLLTTVVGHSVLTGSQAPGGRSFV